MPDQTAPDPLIGTMLGPCRLEAFVGRGGMGRVYRARHLALDRTVAIKFMDQPATAALRQAVLKEARAAAKLDDPHVVAVYEVGEDKGVPYIVLQWVEGESLETRVRRLGALPPAQALAIMRETLTALRAAHALGIVHCDVKPGNILVDRNGAVKLADFGVARLTGSAPAAGEAAVGSFHFMAPEQALGSPPDPRADLYGAGSTWYFALTGSLLFPGGALDALMRHREEPAPDVRLLRPEVTEKTSALIGRLLAKDPSGRPQSADAVPSEMATAGMTLDTDASSSPFRILPPPAAAVETPPPVARAEGPSRAVPEAKPVFAPPPPATPALGSRGAFLFFFAVFGAATVGWPWRSAVFEDWLAGAFFLSASPVLLTIGERRAGWRKAAGIALWLGGIGCFARYVGLGNGTPGAPPLETMIVSALGAACAGGAVYLGLWGIDAEELRWGRGLAPLGGFLLVAGALTWTVPENQGWIGTLSASAPRVLRAWWTTGGLWRWAGLLGLTAAVNAAVRLKISPQADGRRLNWNR